MILNSTSPIQELFALKKKDRSLWGSGPLNGGFCSIKFAVVKKFPAIKAEIW